MAGDDHLGRTAGIHAAAEREGLLHGEPPSLPPRKGAAEFAHAGDGDESQRQQQQIRIGEDGEVRGRDPAMPKNTGMNNAVIRPRKLLLDMPGQDRDSPTRMPATKAPSTVCTPISWRGEGHHQHDHQDHGDDGKLAFENCRWPSGSASQPPGVQCVRLTPRKTMVPITLFATDAAVDRRHASPG
jgi:hypothetical protein